MDTLTAIATRRSIRKYTADPVADTVVRDLLAAGMVAPSAIDVRPWHFIVVTERESLDRLAAGMEFCDMLREATLGIVICGDPRVEKAPGFWVQDCSACTQNMLLAAHALGLGAVWVGLHPMESRVAATREVLGVPDPVIPLSIVAAGHPAETLPGEDRWDDAKVHRDRW